jgi:hypothetical protein
MAGSLPLVCVGQSCNFIADAEDDRPAQPCRGILVSTKLMAISTISLQSVMAPGPAKADKETQIRIKPRIGSH